MPIPPDRSLAVKVAWDPPLLQKDPNYRHYYDDIARNCYNRSFSPSDARAIGHAWSFPPNKQQWLGLIAEAGHPAGSGMLIFYRWLALIKMEQLGLLSQYRSIIITRSDYFYVAPHPPLSKLRPGTIYVPNVEWWGGVTDRQAHCPSKLPVLFDMHTCTKDKRFCGLSSNIPQGPKS